MARSTIFCLYLILIAKKKSLRARFLNLNLANSGDMRHIIFLAMCMSPAQRP
eukprot:SAG31_NODE_12071_length_971_cov_1.025229_2_plen_51_part_01